MMPERNETERNETEFKLIFLWLSWFPDSSMKLTSGKQLRDNFLEKSNHRVKTKVQLKRMRQIQYLKLMTESLPNDITVVDNKQLL